MKGTDLQNTKGPKGSPRLQIVAWEVTRSCNLNCVHCRASSDSGPYPEEMDTDGALSIIDQITEVGRPIVILTGGEPLLRKDIFTLAAYGAEKGLRMVMGSNGTLVTRDMAKQINESGIKRVSISLDGATGKSHDQFRQVRGSFLRAIEGIARLKEEGVEFQINTTLTKQNLSEAKEILDLSVRLGAAAHHVFLLVPTGRAKEMVTQELTAKEYEDTLYWFYQQQSVVPLQFKATCAPQFYRISLQEARAKGEESKRESHGLDAVTRGCLAGISYCFVSHEGVVQPCGYLDLSAGDLRESSFRDIWQDSPIFGKLRNFSCYKGKCGRCKYIAVCGGCRARAYAATGDYLEQEPLCAYDPSG